MNENHCPDSRTAAHVRIMFIHVMHIHANDNLCASVAYTSTHAAPHNAPVTHGSDHCGYYRSYRFCSRMRLRSALCGCCCCCRFASSAPSIALIMHAGSRQPCVCVCVCVFFVCVFICRHTSFASNATEVCTWRYFPRLFAAGPTAKIKCTHECILCTGINASVCVCVCVMYMVGWPTTSPTE